jgi:hypothetical protein
MVFLNSLIFSLSVLISTLNPEQSSEGAVSFRFKVTIGSLALTWYFEINYELCSSSELDESIAPGTSGK